MIKRIDKIKSFKIIKKIFNFFKNKYKHYSISLKQQIKAQKNTKIDDKIKISVITCIFNTNIYFLKKMIKSVLLQTYKNWELIIYDCSDNNEIQIAKVCKKLCKKDKRIIYLKGDNKGISNNQNIAVGNSSGDYLAFLDHDDELSPIALYCNIEAINSYNCLALYSDETHITKKFKLRPFFKPDFSIDLLYSQNYICHLLVVQKKLFDSIGGFDCKFDGAQDYDLVLKIIENINNIYHIDKILYRWREHSQSTSKNPASKPYADKAGLLALNNHLKRKYKGEAYATSGNYLFTYKVHFKFKKPLASIIIPMKDKYLFTKRCIESIICKTNYKNYEILIVNNNSVEVETLDWFNHISSINNIKVINVNCEFNWSKINNIAADHSSGKVLVFLNNDTDIISNEWLDIIVENVQRKEVGCVGALLLYPDNTIQHAGVVVGMFNVADHVFKNMSPIHNISPYVSPMLNRNTLAVTGACLAIEKTKFYKIGKFDESFVICGSDVDFCLRAYQKHYLNVYNSQIMLHHYESKSRSNYIPRSDFVYSEIAYSKYLKNGDPFYNSNLSLSHLIPKENKKYEY